MPRAALSAFRSVERLLASMPHVPNHVDVTESMTDLTASVLDVAAALRDAETERRAIQPPTTTHPGLTVDDAYRIQGVNIAQRLAGGERIVGHKIGLTSLAMQQQLGVDQPDYGVITDAMVVADDSVFTTDALIAPRVEAEFAFLIGHDLPASPTLDELAAAIAGVAVALEIIDSRITDWRIGLVDTIADNASSARIVHGEFIPAFGTQLAELPETEITLWKDGEAVAIGLGSAILGDPLVSLHWLATAIGAYGDHFAAGEIVLAGAVAAAVPLTPGSVWEASAERFPVVTLTSI